MVRDSDQSIVTTENISSSWEIVPIFIDSTVLARSLSKYCIEKIPSIHTPLRFDARNYTTAIAHSVPLIRNDSSVRSYPINNFYRTKILEHDNETFSIN